MGLERTFFLKMVKNWDLSIFSKNFVDFSWSTGFGQSFALKIIVSCLSIETGPSLSLEIVDF